MAGVAAASGAGRGVTTALLSGLSAYFFVSNAEQISAISKEISRATLHYASRPADGQAGVSGLEPRDALLIALLQQQQQQQAAPTGSGTNYVAVASSIASQLPWMSILALAVSGTSLAKSLGFSSSDFFYVTKAQFSESTQALKEGVASVAQALTKVRQELMERVARVDANVDRTRDELREHVTTESEAVRNEVQRVGEDVESLAETVAALERKLNDIDGGVRRANRGIGLLARAVVEPGLASKGLASELESYYVEKPSGVEEALPVALERITPPEVRGAGGAPTRPSAKQLFDKPAGAFVLDEASESVIQALRRDLMEKGIVFGR